MLEYWGDIKAVVAVVKGRWQAGEKEVTQITASSEGLTLWVSLRRALGLGSSTGN